jgi:hypothetical protein
VTNLRDPKSGELFEQLSDYIKFKGNNTMNLVIKMRCRQIYVKNIGMA